MSKWKTVKLNDVCLKIQDGAHTSPKNLYEQPGHGRFLYITSKNIRNNYMDLTNISYVDSSFHNLIYPRCNPEIGDVLLTKDGVNTGNVTINTLKEPFSLLSSVCLIKTDPEKLIPSFLVYYIQSRTGFEQITGQMTGAAIKRIILRTIKNSVIPLPPLFEQKRIVAIVDEAFKGIDRAIANTEKNLTNARELFESVLAKSIFSDSNQNGWYLTTVSDVALSRKGSIRTGPFGSQLLHSEFVEEGIAVLGIDNAVHNEFKWGKKRFITPEKFQQLSRYQVNPGDVLITIMGTCGRCVIAPDDIPIAINTKHLCCITLNQEKCLPGFLHAYFLHHPIAQKFLTDRAKGSIMSGLNMGIIKELPLWLPSAQEQKVIIKKITFLSSEIRGLEAVYQQKIAALNELKQSILQKAFTGELTADTRNQAQKMLEEVAA